MRLWQPGDQVHLVSFDIDGTLEVGDPPGVITLEAVRRARARGLLVGSCSDRTVSYQRALWAHHGVQMDFVVVKQGLPEVRSTFRVEHHLHIGDGPADEMAARQAGFAFLHSLGDDVHRFLHEHGLDH